MYEGRSVHVSRGRFVSVGTRLAGASMALVVLVAAVLYVVVSRYERENLLHAKELSANAVTRLFAATAASAVVFNDDTAIASELATLGGGDEIEYAAIWAVGPAGLGGLLGERRQGGQPVTPGSVPDRLVVERRAEQVVVWAPIRDHEAQTVGMTAVVFSLARENAAIARVERRLLMVSAGVAFGLLGLLTWISRRAIVKPLAVLVGLAKKLEDGEHVHIERHANDEIGQLATAFGNMAIAIRTREERIGARNADLRLVLDNVEQGFITLDREGRMAEECSRIVSAWFGTAAPQATFWSFVARVDPGTADWFELGWEAIADEILPLDVCLAQLPRTLKMGELTLDLSYRPVLEGGLLTKVIVVVTDVTARVARELAEQAQRETTEIFQRILSDRAAFEGFFAEADALVTAIVGAEEGSGVVLTRQLHTLKGAASLFGLDGLASCCHRLEDRLAEGDPLDAASRAALGQHWARLAQVRAGLVSDAHVTLDRSEYDALLAALSDRASAEVIGAVRALAFDSAARRLALIGEQTTQLADRLGKAPVAVVIAPTTLRLPPQKWAGLWSSFSHLVRNVVDHGLEEPAERERGHKAKIATVTYSLQHQYGSVVLTVHDDGRGIDWQRVAAKARARGLPSLTPADLEEALFADGISTNDTVSSTSGRGVGLSAVRATVHDLGGRIEVESVLGAGTTFRIVLPESSLRDEEPAVVYPHAA